MVSKITLGNDLHILVTHFVEKYDCCCFYIHYLEILLDVPLILVLQKVATHHSVVVFLLLQHSVLTPFILSFVLQQWKKLHLFNSFAMLPNLPDSFLIPCINEKNDQNCKHQRFVWEPFFLFSCFLCPHVPYLLFAFVITVTFEMTHIFSNFLLYSSVSRHLSALKIKFN